MIARNAYNKATNLQYQFERRLSIVQLANIFVIFSIGLVLVNLPAMKYIEENPSNSVSVNDGII